MPLGSSRGSPTAGRQDVPLPKLEPKKGGKHLPGKTDVREKLPQVPINQLWGQRVVSVVWWWWLCV